MNAYIRPTIDSLADKATAAWVTNVCDTVQHATSYWVADCGTKLVPTVYLYSDVAIYSLLSILLFQLYWTMNTPDTQFYILYELLGLIYFLEFQFYNLFVLIKYSMEVHLLVHWIFKNTNWKLKTR